MTSAEYPDCYLHVRDGRTGQEWIVEIGPRQKAVLGIQVKAWIKSEFSGELRLDGEIMRRLEGDYYARIMTDGRPPDSIACWDSGGFYLKSIY